MPTVAAPPAVVEIVLDDVAPAGPVEVPSRFGTVRRNARHLRVDRSRVPLGDLFVVSDGERVRMSTDPSVLTEGVPADRIAGQLLAATLGIREEIRRRPVGDVARIPALSVADVAPEMVRCRCATEGLPAPRRTRRRELPDLVEHLVELARGLPGQRSAVACSRGSTSTWLRDTRAGTDDHDPITVVAPADQRVRAADLPAGRLAPLLKALAVAAGQKIEELHSGIGLRPLLTPPSSEERHAPTGGHGSETSGTPLTAVPWLTRPGSAVVHEAMEASRHSWESWLGDLDPDRARIAWAWTDPPVTTVVRHADAAGVALRSPVELTEFVELAFHVTRHRGTSTVDLAGQAAGRNAGTRRTSGAQRLRHRAVRWADTHAATAPTPIPTLLVESGLVDPDGFAATFDHPFLRAQYALALRRTVEAEQWLSNRI